MVKQLSATLQYKSYHLVAAVTQRVRAGSGANGKGQVVLGPPATDENTNGQFPLQHRKGLIAPAGDGRRAAGGGQEAQAVAGEQQRSGRPRSRRA